MNDKQKICLWVGIAAIVVMGLFPPWVCEREERKSRGYGEGYEWKSITLPGPYSWIGDPPRKINSQGYLYIRPKFVDLYRLGIQYFVVAVAAAGLIITLKDKKGEKEVKDIKTHIEQQVNKSDMALKQQLLQPKSLAITSLVFGILAMVFSRGLIGLASALIAIVIGSIALYAMKQSGDLTGRKKALWGLGLGISSIIILIIVVAVEVRTQRAVYELRESNPELFEKPDSDLSKIPTEAPPKTQGWQSDPIIKSTITDRGQIRQGAKQVSLEPLSAKIPPLSALPPMIVPRPIQGNTLEKSIDAQSFYDKGSIELGQENWSAALAYFQKAREENPDDADTWFQVGYCYLGLGLNQDAIENFKQAIKINPDYAEAHYNLGVIYYKFGPHHQEIEACKQAIRINPDDADTWFQVGYCYLGFGRNQDAIEAYKQVVRIKPDYAEAHYNLSVAYCKLGRNQDAIEAYKQVVRIKPDDAEAHYNIGVAYSIIGDKSSALKEYKILKTLDVDEANRLFYLIFKELAKQRTVDGILLSEDKSMATINGETLFEGDEISGARIIKIRKQGIVPYGHVIRETMVEFEKNGKRWTQGVREMPSPEWEQP